MEYSFLKSKKIYIKWMQEAYARGDSEAVYIAELLIEAAVDKELSDVQKAYFNLYWYEGCKMQEIAQLMNVDKSTVSRTLNRALNNLSHFFECVATINKIILEVQKVG